MDQGGRGRGLLNQTHRKPQVAMGLQWASTSSRALALSETIDESTTEA